MRSGTSIGANIEESVGCSSRKDFINKMHIAYREGRETLYWLNLLFDSNYITNDGFQSIKNDCQDLLKILGKIISTSKINN
ncbi:MAG: four helix bundle protein [bacterium]|nr:four helix bundle protein [bacterium]